MVQEINIQLINRCQLKCKWCARSWLDEETLEKRESEYMDYDTFRMIVDKCLDYGITHFDLTPTMGDVLLDTSLFQKLNYLTMRTRCKKFFFTTNLIGLPITIPMVHKLLNYEKLHLGVSVYGHCSNTYFNNTNKDLYNCFVTKLQTLFKCYDKDGASLEFFIRYPIKFENMPEGILKNVLRLFNSRFYNAKINEHEQYNYNWGGLIPYGSFDTLLGPIQKHGVCPTARRGTILHNGDFALCYMNDAYKSTVIGNIFNESLEDIYNGEMYRKIIGDQAQNKYHGVCKVCNERWWEYGRYGVTSSS